MSRGAGLAGANEPAQYRFFIFGWMVTVQSRLTGFGASGNNVRQAGKRSSKISQA
jgi:hypothetical protein